MLSVINNNNNNNNKGLQHDHAPSWANQQCTPTACSAITFSYCTAVQKQLLHGTPHSLTCTV